MTNLEKRLARINAMERADKTRFQPNPNGEGYLTRAERYQELRWQIQRRMK